MSELLCVLGVTIMGLLCGLLLGRSWGYREGYQRALEDRGQL